MAGCLLCKYAVSDKFASMEIDKACYVNNEISER